MNIIKRSSYLSIKRFVSALLLLVTASLMNHLHAMDQCNTTAQCKATYGASATDCKNSFSPNSVCICGGARCDANTNPKPATPRPNPVTPPPKPKPSGDQCNTTAQCRAKYGSATDCKNSASPNSVCFCGAQRCDANTGPATPQPKPKPGGTRKLGKFTIGKDLLLSQYDNRPDADDIHSQGAAGAMLRDSRFSGMDYYGVLGTYGKQGGRYLNSTSVMNACYGNRWVHAHPKGGPNWNAALNNVLGRVNTALRRGGTIWIQEAGQSDFTAALVRRVKNSNPGLARNRIQVVQHSDYNERNTSNGELDYVKRNTKYNKIPDGNAAGNGSPQFNTRNGSQWGRAVNNAKAGACWREARRVANDRNATASFKNPAIAAGGMDFSDTVELTWITGFNGLRNHVSFFDTFPK